ncbi:hypothetical protein D3C78_1460270 [compost metagenome]
MQKFIAKSEQLSERFGGYAISISLFLPFLRHATPFVTGVNRMSYKRFSLFAYPTAFVWTLIYFVIGSIVGDNVQELADKIVKYDMWIVYALIAAALIFIIFKYVKDKRKKDQIEQSI